MCKNLSNYTDMRVNVELPLIFHLIKHFDLKSFLEVGFFQGNTFGVYVEACQAGSRLTALDIDMSKSGLHDSIYASSDAIKNKEIELVEIDSLEYTPTRKYDFINIDAAHCYPRTLDDIERYIKHIESFGILMIDDYLVDGVDRSIDEFMQNHDDWVPFLLGEQSAFFHHVSHDAVEFLDVTLETFGSFCALDNIIYKNHLVKKVSCLPIITNQNDIFFLVCQRTNI